MTSLFTGARHAAQYLKYRPTYPPEVYTTIVDYCKQGSNAFSQALDIGCGSGQSTFPLLSHFKNVTGIDPSETQLAEARTLCQNEGQNLGKDHELLFKTGTAENLSEYASSSVDLITCAQAFHWINTDSFYPEAKRILTSGGVLSAYGYGNVKVNSEEANAIIWEFYKEKVGPYWDDRRCHIDNHLADFQLPFSDFRRVDSLTITREMHISSFIGYVSSWSAYQTYMKVHPDSQILEDLQKRLCKIFSSTKPDESLIQAKWPVFVLLGRNS